MDGIRGMMGKIIILLIISGTLITAVGGGLNHPIHLHGFAFNVLAMGNLNSGYDNIQQLRRLLKGKSLLRSKAPPLKDTIAIPSEGYAAVRFIADNPGKRRPREQN